MTEFPSFKRRVEEQKKHFKSFGREMFRVQMKHGGGKRVHRRSITTAADLL
jgi:hypothetical protein